MFETRESMQIHTTTSIKMSWNILEESNLKISHSKSLTTPPTIFVFLRNDSKLYNSYELATKEIWAVYYLNNNALEKCTNGKAFNIVTIAHFVYLPNLQF